MRHGREPARLCISTRPADGSMIRMKRLLSMALVLVMAASLGPHSVSAELQIGQQFASRHPHPYPTAIPQGCAMCRGTGNCSKAVDNDNEGVYCGDLITTFQPCCCQYRNECMTTIFSERCECLSSEEVEQFISARFTMFCIFTGVMWVALIWDRMCGRPYKVMNSNRHHMLANSPTAAGFVGEAAPRETARDQELLEIDHSEETSDAPPSLNQEPTTRNAAPSSSSTEAAQPQSQRTDQAAAPDIVLDLQEVPLTPRRDAGSIQSV